METIMEDITNSRYVLYVTHPVEPRREVWRSDDFHQIMSYCQNNNYEPWEIEKDNELIARSATA